MSRRLAGTSEGHPAGTLLGAGWALLIREKGADSHKIMTDPDDPLAIRRKRLLYQSRHRGTQEADLLIGGFAAAHLPGMSPAQLDTYERLLAESDVDLVNWLTGRAVAPDDVQSDVFDLLKNFKLHAANT
jgi:antitoxin CptB